MITVELRRANARRQPSDTQFDLLKNCVLPATQSRGKSHANGKSSACSAANPASVFNALRKHPLIRLGNVISILIFGRGRDVAY